MAVLFIILKSGEENMREREYFLAALQPELFINCVISSRREFADGAEFKTRGTRSQIPEKLGHVPEFGARLQIHDRER